MTSVFTGCATSPAVKSTFSLANVKTVYVSPFSGESSALVTTEFVRQLRAVGLGIADRPGAADATLTGTIPDVRANQKLMVYLGDAQTLNSEGKALMVTNPIVSPSGSQALRESAPAGLPSAQVVSVQTVVSVTAHLTVPALTTVVWAAQYSYEGVDMPSTVQAVVQALIRSMAAVLPQVSLAQPGS